MLHRHPLLSLVTGAYVLFVGWLTLTPQPVEPADDLMTRVLRGLHERGYAEWLDYNRLEFLLNIAMFVPIGMFLLLLFGSGGWWVAALASFALTAGIETAQRNIPGRVSDPRDLVSNMLGASFGILIALVLTLPATLRRRRTRRNARRPRSFSDA
ncbi:MAG: VanZ family protein [Nocardioidaceae bacterium]